MFKPSLTIKFDKITDFKRNIMSVHAIVVAKYTQNLAKSYHQVKDKITTVSSVSEESRPGLSTVDRIHTKSIRLMEVKKSFRKQQLHSFHSSL